MAAPFAIVGAAYGIALWTPGVLSLVLMSLLLYVATLVPIAIARALGIHDKSILLGSGVFIILFVLLEIAQIDVPLKPLVLPVGHLALLLVSTLLTPRLRAA